MTDWTDALADLQGACRDTFGVPMIYIPSVEKRPEYQGNPIEFSAIFDDSREAVGINAAGVEVVGRRTVLEVVLADLGIDPKEGDSLEINDIAYQVIDVEPDGHGAAVLVLSREKNLFA